MIERVLPTMSAMTIMTAIRGEFIATSLASEPQVHKGQSSLGLMLPQHTSGNKNSKLGSRGLRRKWQAAEVITAPAGMLDRRALIAARAAAGALPQPSLDASAPQRMTATAQASGALLVAV